PMDCDEQRHTGECRGGDLCPVLRARVPECGHRGEIAFDPPTTYEQIQNAKQTGRDQWPYGVARGDASEWTVDCEPAARPHSQRPHDGGKDHEEQCPTNARHLRPVISFWQSI